MQTNLALIAPISAPPNNKKEQQLLKTADLSPETQDFSTALAKTVLLTGAISVADIKLTPFITHIVSHNFGFCLGNFLSGAGTRALASIVNPIVSVNARISRLFGSNLAAEIMMPALCEEVEFRWFVQDILLKELPRKILEQVSPKHAHLVDSEIVRINRIAASALFFAYCHLHALGCSTGGGINHLVGGLLYGAIYEYSDWSLFGVVNLHTMFNLVQQL